MTLEDKLKALKFDHTDMVDGYNTLCDKDITSIINLVDKEVPEHKHIKVPYYLVELQKAYENGYNQAVDDMRAKLKGVSNG